jgi:hypothetical protein
LENRNGRQACRQAKWATRPIAGNELKVELKNQSKPELSRMLSVRRPILRKLVATLGLLVPTAVWAQDPISFNRDIRPILSDNCFFCHGPDKNKREADLRLDTSEGLHGIESRPGIESKPGVIVPGKPQESLLIERILSEDPQDHMPPASSGKKLTAEQIELLKRWVAQGGKYEGHWAFLPRKVAGQAGGAIALSDQQIRDRIDGLIAGDLAKQGLVPSPKADRVTLLRRLYIDLIGLPPTENQVQEFLADNSPDAYQKLVDRLLASPHFGERMAMWWMDLVRYADSVGYHGDQEMSVSPFREYVIRSFNNNKPFDTFTIEQLAGDLLPAPTLEQRVASGYNRLGMMSAEGGVQDREYLAKYMAERVRNASGAWLGITLGCAECHDHKFDPLSTRDFYKFGAFFADIKERGLYSGANSDGNWGPFVKVPTEQEQQELKSIDQQMLQVQGLIDQNTPELLADFDAWQAAQVPWTTLKADAIVSLEGATLKAMPDGSFLASGKNPSTDSYLFTSSQLPAGVTAFRLEVLPDDSLPSKGPGRAGNGNFVLTEFVVHHRLANGPTNNVSLANPSATYEQIGAIEGNPYGKWSAEGALDNDAKGRKWGWAVMEKVGKPQAAIFETAEDLKIGPGDSIVVGLWQNLDNPQHTIGRFRLSATTAKRPVQASTSLPTELEGVLAKSQADRSDDERAKLLAYYRSIAPRLEPQRTELAALRKNREELEKRTASTLVTEAVPPRMVRVLARGNWMDESGEVVLPAFPQSLATLTAGVTPDSSGRLTRLDLAKWIVDPNHPLTTRVVSNRLWKLFFGAGISRKLDDLGAQGEWPTHPELLDELAQWMIDTGWDVKRWIKTVVMTESYQRSSNALSDVRDKDPYNRYLARQSRFRLDAEMVRDNALSVSGLLVTKLGGRSVRPYQPPGYWAYLNFPQREWQNGAGEELYRRGLYTHWQRQYLHPSLLVFDAPNREECTAERPRSNTPLQSLVLLNDPAYIEAARSFAELIARHTGDVSAKLEYAFQRALSRSPSDKEKEVLVGLYTSHFEQFKSQAAAAKDLLSVGSRPAASDIDSAELAAWTSVARALMNLHEFITRY